MKGVILLILLLSSAFLRGQERPPKQKEIGINMTGLLTLVTPFKQSAIKTGPYNLTWRSGRGNDFFVIEVGANISGDFDNNDNDHFNLALGYLRKTPVSKKFTFYRMYNFLAYGGSFNTPNEAINNNDEAGFGFGLGFGFEYNITDVFRLSSETILFAGSRQGSFNLTFIPPVGLFLIARIK